MEKLCNQFLLKSKISEAAPSQECSNIFSDDSDSDDSIQEKHRILYRQQSGVNHRTRPRQRSIKKMMHTIEILMPDKEGGSKKSVEILSPLKKFALNLKSSDSLGDIDHKKRNRRRHTGTREKASNLFLRNTMMSVDEPEKVVFLHEEDSPDEEKRNESILKNHFIFFCFRRTKGKSETPLLVLTSN